MTAIVSQRNKMITKFVNETGSKLGRQKGSTSYKVFCKFETVSLRTNSKAADNKKINANFKKGGFIGNQTVMLSNYICT